MSRIFQYFDYELVNDVYKYTKYVNNSLTNSIILSTLYIIYVLSTTSEAIFIKLLHKKQFWW